MKKCPVCEKTFDDSMRFCQTDGTPLDDIIEQTPDDPYKTMVGRPDDIFPAPPLPPDDPFKTMVAGSQPKDESGDLLQLPEEFDAMKTSVVSPDEMREHLDMVSSQENAAGESAPPSPFDEPASPFELNVDESPDLSSSTPNDIPRFNEPSLNPPDFGDMPSDASENITEIIPPESVPPGNPFSFDSNPVPPPASAPNPFGDSPFNTPNDPIPSPFDDVPQSFEKPSTPMPQYKEPEPPTVLGANPFDQPPTFGQQQQDPFNQPFNTPAAQNDWAPPPAPVSNWQDQGLGANTPFQPPQAIAQGQDQTLPIISLVAGVVSICCPIAILTGPAALITGFLGIKNINENPNQYGGKGLAIAGMIIGGLFFILSIIWWVLRLLGLAYWSFN